MTTVVQWTVEDVAAWLEQCLHLPYAEEFVQAGIDGVQLVHLTNQGLLSLGVDTEEHVKCLLDHIAVLRIQWERSLRGVQDAETSRASSHSSFRSTSLDGHLHNSKRIGRMGRSVWPRVGSPILHAMAGKNQRQQGLKADPARVEELASLDPDSFKDTERTKGQTTMGAEVTKVGHFGYSPPANSPHAEPHAGVQAISIPLPSERLPTPSSALGGSSARCGSEAMSRCSSAPTSSKRGPSAAAAGGASLFLSDQSRGAFFGTTTRGVEALPDTLGPGPACYDADAAAFKTSFRANIGSMKFSSEPRRTMECMYVRGAAGPGSGKYHPPPRSASRGGSFPRAPRWNARSTGRGGLPGTPPTFASPGPTSYKPNHAALSTLR